MLSDTIPSQPSEPVPCGLPASQTLSPANDQSLLSWAMTDSGHNAEGSWQPAYSAYDTCTFSMDSEGLALAMCQHQHPQCHALGTLAGGIAHDLNNTLHAVLGYAELLMEDTPPDSLAWRHLQQVVIASTRAKDLVQHMLQVSRQQEQARGPVQLAPVIDEVLSLLHAS